MDKEDKDIVLIIKVCRIHLSFFLCPWESKADRHILDTIWNSVGLQKRKGKAGFP